MEHPASPPLKDHTPDGWKYPALSRGRPARGGRGLVRRLRVRDVGRQAPADGSGMGKGRPRPGWPALPVGHQRCGEARGELSRGRIAVAAEMDRQEPPAPPGPGSPVQWGKSRRSMWRRNCPRRRWDVGQTLPPQVLTGATIRLRLSFRGAPYGVLHLAGNAAEWVADWYGRRGLHQRRGHRSVRTGARRGACLPRGSYSTTAAS